MPTASNISNQPGPDPDPRESAARAGFGHAFEVKNAYLPPWKREALQAAVLAVERAAEEVDHYPPALKPVAVAQFLLESNWGRSEMGARNYFGIKARPGEPFVMRKTHEHLAGRDVQVDARFRAFRSMDECFAAHAELFFRTRGGREIYAAALSHPTDPIAFARALTGVYATDPLYGEKLVQIMRDRGLLETFGFSSPPPTR